MPHVSPTFFEEHTMPLEEKIDEVIGNAVGAFIVYHNLGDAVPYLQISYASRMPPFVTVEEFGNLLRQPRLPLVGLECLTYCEEEVVWGCGYGGIKEELRQQGRKVFDTFETWIKADDEMEYDSDDEEEIDFTSAEYDTIDDAIRRITHSQDLTFDRVTTFRGETLVEGRVYKVRRPWWSMVRDHVKLRGPAFYWLGRAVEKKHHPEHHVTKRQREESYEADFA